MLNVTETASKTLDYRTDGRLTVAALTDIAKDLRDRKVPKDAEIILCGISHIAVKFKA